MSGLIFTPRPYGQLITNHILDVPRGAVWAGMGMGKTVSTLNAINDAQLVDGRPVLVLAPLRVARSTWPDEAKKWAHLRHLRVMPIVGNEAERVRALKYDANIYTTNYEQLPWLVEHFDKKAWPFARVVADESTKLKGFRLRQGTARAKALGSVAHTKIKYFNELTGTPSPNGLEDLWGQTWFLDKGHRLGRTYDDFRKRWFEKSYDGYSVHPKDYAQAQIQRALQDVCMTIEAKDWFDLREPVVTNLYVDLPAKARAQYEDMEKRMFIELSADRTVEALGAAVKTMRCLHVASGFTFYGEHREWQDLHAAKIGVLEEIVEEAAGMPVLVAYQWAPNLERLLKAFPKARHLDKDPQTIADWNAGKIPILFAHPQSAGHGLNLQDGGNILVYLDHWWNLEERLQIFERLGPTRQLQAGHDRSMFVYNIIARDTVDEMVIERVNSKREVQDILMDAMKVRGYK